jgi:hypothetical protein
MKQIHNIINKKTLKKVKKMKTKNKAELIVKNAGFAFQCIAR